MGGRFLLSDSVRMQTRVANARAVQAVLSGSTRITQCNGLRAENAWLSPFRGFAVTKPNRVEAVFSERDDVISLYAPTRSSVVGPSFRASTTSHPHRSRSDLRRPAVMNRVIHGLGWGVDDRSSVGVQADSTVQE